MAKSSKKLDYEVGYKRPPRSTQFQPGQSGNRKGRPIGSLNLISILDKELRTRVNFTENGKVKSATQGAVMMKQLVRKAATGHDKATLTVIDKVQDSERRNSFSQPADSVAATPNDQVVLQGLSDRLRRQGLPGLVVKTTDAKPVRRRAQLLPD